MLLPTQREGIAHGRRTTRGTGEGGEKRSYHKAQKQGGAASRQSEAERQQGKPMNWGGEEVRRDNKVRRPSKMLKCGSMARQGSKFQLLNPCWSTAKPETQYEHTMIPLGEGEKRIKRGEEGRPGRMKRKKKKEDEKDEEEEEGEGSSRRRRGGNGGVCMVD
ncbi:hypothetical protein B296_00032605 [Ensete ventricosum]|uniref:Uncharacterized protein n=1 Tax=Ensete ventricosum TaxID=4639 RepID=A0A426YYB2_ENSVE|nr:hypothetical protein B296_00032605 [Ensete ventricosum]